MNGRRFPHDAADHLARQLAARPSGTRIVLVWDPERHVGAGVDIFDSAGQAWATTEFAGEDAQFTREWAARDRTVRTVVLLRLPGGLRARWLDLSFQEQLLRDADGLIDLTLRAILGTYTDVAWNADAVRGAAGLLSRNLGGALTELARNRSRILGRHDLLAAALAASAPGARADDFLTLPAGSPETVLLQSLHRLLALPAGAREVGQSLLIETAGPGLREWLALPLDRALYIVLVGLALQAFNRPLDLVNLRGLGVQEASAALLDILRRLIQEQSWHADLLDVAAQAERELDLEQLDRLAGLLSSPALPDLALAAGRLPPRLRDRVLYHALLNLPADPSALAALPTWTGEADWAGSQDPEHPPLGELAAAFTLFAAVTRRLATPPPGATAPIDLANAYLAADLATLELDLAQAMDYVRRVRDRVLTGAVQPIFSELRRRARALLDAWDQTLADSILDPSAFNAAEESVSTLLRSEVFGAGRVPPRVPHVWLVIFDGMRWDTWRRVIRPALAEVFTLEQESGPRFALLPSITGISRTAALAGAAPPAWLSPTGNHTRNELTLGATGFRLPPTEARSRWRLIKRAEEDVDSWVVDAQPCPYNTIIYNISDDRIHHFSLDVAELNREIRQRVADRVVQDLLTVVSPDDVLIVTSDHGFIELDAAEGTDLEVAGATVNYRYIVGVRQAGYPIADLGDEGLYSLVVGRRWLRRPGGTHARYSHGGISFDEILVPGAVFRHTGAARLDLRWSSLALELNAFEGETAIGKVELANQGNRPVQFALTVSDPRAEIQPASGTIAPRDRLMVLISGQLPPGRSQLTVRGAFGLHEIPDHQLPALSVGIRVEETPGKVEVDFGALDLLDEE